MAKDKSRSRSDHAPHARGPKTHKADIRLNRGEPKPAVEEEKPDDGDTTRQKKLRDEHPTRMKETGRQPDRRNR